MVVRKKLEPADRALWTYTINMHRYGIIYSFDMRPLDLHVDMIYVGELWPGIPEQSVNYLGTAFQ